MTQNDAFDNIAEIFDCDREFVEDMAKVAFDEENSSDNHAPADD